MPSSKLIALSHGCLGCSQQNISGVLHSFLVHFYAILGFYNTNGFFGGLYPENSPKCAHNGCCGSDRKLTVATLRILPCSSSTVSCFTSPGVVGSAIQFHAITFQLRPY